ncbi:MAG: 16S rRNA (guanine(966)-N(2))-methyltransferase RsmD [Alicyclobacillus sp.]|nr:16S rRNA (guanine(966)-N(2))-methyltransferase RsmD [Alicyclobacillus sp.]
MRIIAGQWRGLRLTAPAGTVARPTTDRVKEAMFNLMGWGWSGGWAIDLFAGSGALGLEALSRGADAAVFMDVHRASLAAIRENVRRCRAEAVCQVWAVDWRRGWQRVCAQGLPVGWVFVDPPYPLGLWPEVLQVLGDSLVPVQFGVVCEHPAAVSLPAVAGSLRLAKQRAYGDVAVSLYSP